MVSKFRPSAAAPQGLTPGSRFGVCAMGPVGDGDTLIWMRVWVWQQDGESVAACGGHQRRAPRRRTASPRAGAASLHAQDRDWMIQTELEPGSKQFSNGKPALARRWRSSSTATAAIDIEQWSQAVMVGSQELRADGQARLAPRDQRGEGRQHAVARLLGHRFGVHLRARRL